MDKTTGLVFSPWIKVQDQNCAMIEHLTGAGVKLPTTFMEEFRVVQHAVKNDPDSLDEHSKEITSVYNRLSELVAPAKPEAILLLKNASLGRKWYNLPGQLPIVNNALVLGIASIIAFVISVGFYKAYLPEAEFHAGVHAEAQDNIKKLGEKLEQSVTLSGNATVAMKAFENKLAKAKVNPALRRDAKDLLIKELEQKIDRQSTTAATYRTIAASQSNALKEAKDILLIQRVIFDSSQRWNMLFYGLAIVFSAAVGVTFSTLYKLNHYITSLTYESKYEASYLMRYVLGISAGIVIANFELFQGDGDDLLDTVQVNMFLFALLAGYSAELIHNVLTHLVETMQGFIVPKKQVKPEQIHKEVKQKADAEKTGNGHSFLEELSKIKEKVTGDKSFKPEDIHKYVDEAKEALKKKDIIS